MHVKICTLTQFWMRNLNLLSPFQKSQQIITQSFYFLSVVTPENFKESKLQKVLKNSPIRAPPELNLNFQNFLILR